MSGTATKTYTLAATWIYRGKIYEAGRVELPDDVADALRAKGAFETTAEPTAFVGDLVPNPHPTTTLGNDLGLPDIDDLTAEQMTNLRNAYRSVDQLTAASDDDLRKLDKFGKVSVERVRAFIDNARAGTVNASSGSGVVTATDDDGQPTTTTPTASVTNPNPTATPADPNTPAV